ncbi:MAG: uL15 family ribosomal protein [Patescibacteria group bacterium]|nr:uL15 family ribosomal protein [Patescibacteria group bacterium]
MRLHELQPKTKRPSQKRVGRGGKRGTTSGKGQKGQKSRAGHKIRPAQRDLVIRTPKRRGYKNKPKHPHAFALSLDIINRLSESVITKEVLVEHRIIRSASIPVKVVANGSIEHAKEIVGFPVSDKAAQKIKKSGGSIK